MFKIISDSACDLSQKYIKKNDITIVPMSVSFDGETYYRDSIDITRDQCYQKMVEDPKLFPKTSLPSVESYADAFRKFAKDGLSMVCFTISISLSGSYNSARLAKELVEEEYPNAKIAVFDSLCNTVSQAMVIDQIVRMKNNGLTFEEMTSLVEPLLHTGRIFFTVGSLDYLKTGGRIGKVATAATGKLGIKPIIIMKDGEIGLGGIGRNRNKIKERILEIADKYITDGGKDNYIVSVGYGYDVTEGVNFMNAVEDKLNVKLNTDTNVAIGIASAVHTGPYSIGIGVIQKYETIIQP